jgi:hypothetical protein
MLIFFLDRLFAGKTSKQTTTFFNAHTTRAYHTYITCIYIQQYQLTTYMSVFLYLQLVMHLHVPTPGSLLNLPAGHLKQSSIPEAFGVSTYLDAGHFSHASKLRPRATSRYLVHIIIFIKGTEIFFFLILRFLCKVNEYARNTRTQENSKI